MQPAEFTSQASGQVVRHPTGYHYFLPARLPPSLEWSAPLAGLLSNAERALGRLDGYGRTLPNPHLLIRPFLSREAALSSRIEGTQAGLPDLFYFEAAPSEEPAMPDVLEISNYVAALTQGLERVQELPPSRRLVCELHETLMQGVRGDNLTPGEFRRSQNWIGPQGCSLSDATYVPPPPEPMAEAFSDLEKFLNADDSWPPLVKIGLAHVQFEMIHPFLDGNGRIGRLLITLLLCHWKLLAQPMLYLSAYFEKSRSVYYERLLSVSQRGDWQGWLAYFLRGVDEQASDAVMRCGQLVALRESYVSRFQRARASALIAKLIDSLFATPVVTGTRTARLLQVSHQAAMQNIEKLVAAGILSEVTSRRRNRVYVAQELIQLIDAP